MTFRLLLAQVPIETAEKLADNFNTRALAITAALAVLGLIALAFYSSRLNKEIGDFRKELSKVHEKRVSDRDTFLTELKEMSQGIADLVEKNHAAMNSFQRLNPALERVESVLVRTESALVRVEALLEERRRNRNKALPP